MKKIFLLTLLCCATVLLQAQEYGHLNFGELLSAMPETATAEKDLQDYNDDLVKQGEEKQNVLNEAVAGYRADEASQNFSPLQMGEKAKKIQALEQDLVKFQQEGQQLLNAKRQELLGPVIEKATKAIEAIAKEGGYLLIFDTSVFNAVLFADESIDVMAKVKSKLGL